MAALLQRARLPYALSPDAERGTVAVTSPEGATHTAEELVVRCAGSGQTCPAFLLHSVASQVCGKPGALPHAMGIAPRGRLRRITTETASSRHVDPAAALAAGTTARTRSISVPLHSDAEWRLSWVHQASIIHYARRITEAASDGAAVLDCVIAIPAFFGPAQRQALVDAAQLAGAAPLCVPCAWLCFWCCA